MQPNSKLVRASFRLLSALCTAAVIGATSLDAQTWQTVLDYQLASGQAAGGRGIAANAAGQVLSGGIGYDGSTNAHGLALITDTTQLASGSSAIWTLGDDSLLDNPIINPSQYSSQTWDCGYDSNGDLYSVGQLYSKAGATSWYVRKSSNGGLNWSTTDLYQYSSGLWSGAYGFVGDGSGGVYAVGGGESQVVTGSGKRNLTNNIPHWLVRKSTDGGQSWVLVDDVTNSIGGSAMAVAVAPGAGVFVAGPYAYPGPWVVRMSVTGNAGTWATVDGPIPNAIAQGVGSDSQGDVYAVGEQFIITGSTGFKNSQTTGYEAWVTRMSSDGGRTWVTVDRFTLVPPKPNQNTPGAYARGIGTDSVGNVVVVGDASDGTSTHWIVRRRDPSSGQWATLDDFLPAGGAIAFSVVGDSAGHLLVAGQANWGYGTGTHSIVREY